MLATLDTSDLHHELDTLDAQMAAERAQLTVIEQGGSQSSKAAIDADLKSLDVDLANARKNYEAEMRLLNQNAGTRQAAEQAKQTVDSLQAKRDGLLQRRNSLVSPTDRAPSTRASTKSRAAANKSRPACSKPLSEPPFPAPSTNSISNPEPT